MPCWGMGRVVEVNMIRCGASRDRRAAVGRQKPSSWVDGSATPRMARCRIRPLELVTPKNGVSLNGRRPELVCLLRKLLSWLLYRNDEYSKLGQ